MLPWRSHDLRGVGNLDGQSKIVDQAQCLVAEGVLEAYVTNATPYWRRYTHAGETIGRDLARLQGNGVDLHHVPRRANAFRG